MAPVGCKYNLSVVEKDYMHTVCSVVLNTMLGGDPPTHPPFRTHPAPLPFTFLKPQTG